MKNIFYLIFLSCLFLSGVASAQDTIPDNKSKKKKEKKEKTVKQDDKKPKPDKKSYREIKKEMREYYYDIEKFEQAKLDKAIAQRKADSLNTVLANMKKDQDDNGDLVQRINAERAKNQETLQALEKQAAAPAERKAIPQDGVFFTVQIGAYNQRNISQLINQSDLDLSVEIDESGLKRYLLGGYRNYEDAANARKKIRQLGVKDAWIVSYKEGKRVNMTEVRSTPISEEELRELEKK